MPNSPDSAALLSKHAPPSPFPLPTNTHSYQKISALQSFNGYDTHLMSSLTILDASPAGTVTFSLHIDGRYANINGVMHGGAAGVIFDMATTTALGPLARPGYWEWVSLNFL